MKKELNEFLRENGLVFLLVMYTLGLLCILSSIFNWERFFNNNRIQTLEKHIGRKGVRILYGAIGLLIIITSTLAVTSGQIKM